MWNLLLNLIFSIAVGLILGGMLFYLMYYAVEEWTVSFGKWLFNYAFSPDDFSISISIACLIAFFSLRAKLPSHWLADRIKNLFYFKFFSGFSTILGFCVALNIQHKINFGNLDGNITVIASLLSLLIIISSAAFMLMVNEYNSTKNPKIVETAKYMLLLSSTVFLLLGIFI